MIRRVVLPTEDIGAKKIFEEDVVRRHFICAVLEIQVAKYQHWEKRSLYYLSKTFINTISRGQPYTKLRRCISISLLDFNLLDTPDCHSVFKWRDKAGNIYTNMQEIHIIELRKPIQPESPLRDKRKFS